MLCPWMLRLPMTGTSRTLCLNPRHFCEPYHEVEFPIPPGVTYSMLASGVYYDAGVRLAGVRDSAARDTPDIFFPTRVRSRLSLMLCPLADPLKFRTAVPLGTRGLWFVRKRKSYAQVICVVRFPQKLSVAPYALPMQMRSRFARSRSAVSISGLNFFNRAMHVDGLDIDSTHTHTHTSNQTKHDRMYVRVLSKCSCHSFAELCGVNTHGGNRNH